MRTSKFYTRFKNIGLTVFLIVTVLSLQSCITMLLIQQDAKPSIEHDEVKGITRYKSILYYHFAVENSSSFKSGEQHIYKEIKGFQNEYKIYEYLKLDPRVDYIEDTIYFIVDGKAFPIQISSQYSEILSDLDTDEEDVILADSSKTTIVSNYELINYTNLSIQYTMDEDLVKKIANAQDAKIRYYSPPEMITLRLSNLKLKAFKDLSHSQLENLTPKSQYIYD